MSAIPDIKRIKEQLSSGDNSCLQFVFDEYSRYCIGYLRRKFGCTKEDAEDAFTDAMIIFRENILLEKLQTLTNARGYLLKICINRQRESVAQKERQSNYVEEVRYRWYEDISKTDDRLQRINERAFSSLNSKCQSILKYFYIEKYSMAEIAEMLHLANANTVKVSKARCYKRWKELTDELKKTMK